MRKLARECAFKLVYEYIFVGEKNDFTAHELAVESSLDAAAEEYMNEVYSGVIDRFDELKSDIEATFRRYGSGRVFKCDMAIMLLALYEMRYMPDIPHKVSVNEALELSKIYSGDSSAGFINGVLSNFITGVGNDSKDN